MSSNLNATSSSLHRPSIADENPTTARTTKGIYNSQHQPIHRGHKIGTGGEGTVYEINGQPDLVAKLYHERPAPEKTEKLLTLASLGTERLFRLSAWPVDVLRATPGGPVIGFVMKKIRDAEEVHALHSPKSRLQKFPEASWSFLLYAAANLARAVAVMHEHGFVVGDLNPKNILVTRKATIHLLDCDSFQLNVNGRTLRCDAGFPEYTPPELQGVPFRETDRTPNHDCFGLAVVIFQLLFLGRHPFSGRFLGTGEMPLERAIGESRFAFGEDAVTRQMQPPPGALPLNAIPAELTSLFGRAFLTTIRPTAADWIAPLETLAKSLKKCEQHSGHHFYEKLPDCPWCELEMSTRARLFNFAFAGTAAQRGHFRLDEIWKQIDAISPPAALLIEQPPLLPLLPASPSAVAVGRQQRNRFFLALMFSVFSGFTIGWFAGFCFGISLLLLAIFIARGILENSITPPLSYPAHNKILTLYPSVTSDLQPFEEAKASAQNVVQQLEQRWLKEGGMVRFEEKLDALRTQRESYESLPQIRADKLRQLEANARTTQLDDFLEQFSIAETLPQNLNEEVRASLLSAGIETAADITPQTLQQKINGLERHSETALLRWREQLERTFVFDAAQSISQQTRLQVEKEVDELRQRLELEISNGAEHLRRICRDVESRRERYLAGLTNARQALRQAESNLLAATQHVSMIPVIALLFLTFMVGSLMSSSLETVPPIQDERAPVSQPSSSPPPLRKSEMSDKARQALELYKKGVEFRRDERFKEAAESFQKAVQLDPQVGGGYEDLGYVLYRLGRYDESIAASLAALKFGHSFGPYYQLGLAYKAQEKWPEAKEALLNALLFFPNFSIGWDNSQVQTYYELGLVMKEMGILESSIQTLENSLKTLGEPELNATRIQLVNLYLASGNFDAALAQYEILKPQNQDMAENLKKLIVKYGFRQKLESLSSPEATEKE